MFLFINLMSTCTSWNAAVFLISSNGIIGKGSSEETWMTLCCGMLWDPWHLRCYSSFKLQLWPGSHASWAFSCSIAPMSCLATTGVTGVFMPGDVLYYWTMNDRYTSLHHIQILICHLHPLAFRSSEVVEICSNTWNCAICQHHRVAANKALHRRCSRVWCCHGTYFFKCCDWER